MKPEFVALNFIDELQRSRNNPNSEVQKINLKESQVPNTDSLFSFDIDSIRSFRYYFPYNNIEKIIVKPEGAPKRKQLSKRRLSGKQISKPSPKKLSLKKLNTLFKF